MDERMFHIDHDGAIKQRMESDIFGESEVGINSIYQYCYYYKEYEDTLPPDIKTRIERLRCDRSSLFCMYLLRYHTVISFFLSTYYIYELRIHIP